MRGILIDPFKREVRDVDGNWNDYTVICRFLAQGALGPLHAPLCNGPRFAPDVRSYVDDEGCFRPEQAWFRLKGYPHALPGYLLLTGADGENEADVRPDFLVKHLADITTWDTPEAAKADFPPTTIGPLGGPPAHVIPVDFDDIRPLESRYG